MSRLRQIVRLGWKLLSDGWKPALGWTAAPCSVYVFAVGPAIGHPADTVQVVAYMAGLGVLIYAHTREKIAAAAQ